MDMSEMGGMDMGSSALFKPTNMSIARMYWYVVAVTVGVLVLRNAIDRVRIYLV